MHRSLRDRVMHVVDTVIAPILRNDGGRLEILGIDEASGELSIRFVGSCANCPYSLLSMEQLVKPSLLAISGVTRVSHRAQMPKYELERSRPQEVAIRRRPSDPGCATTQPRSSHRRLTVDSRPPSPAS